MLARTRRERQAPDLPAHLRRAWAAYLSAQDAWDVAATPEAVDAALERLQAAEQAFFRALKEVRHDHR